MEVALAEYLAKQTVVTTAKPEGQPLLALVEQVWDPDGPERFVKFAQSCGWLLNTEEDRRWKYIQSVLRIQGSLTQKQTDLLRKHYQTIEEVASGELPETELVKLRLLMKEE
jgi:hypothetical protein